MQLAQHEQLRAVVTFRGGIEIGTRTRGGPVLQTTRESGALALRLLDARASRLGVHRRHLRLRQRRDGAGVAVPLVLVLAEKRERAQHGARDGVAARGAGRLRRAHVHRLERLTLAFRFEQPRLGAAQVVRVHASAALRPDHHAGVGRQKGHRQTRMRVVVQVRHTRGL